MRIFCDFDGTVTLKDSGDLFFQTFSQFEPHHSMLLDGKTTVREYYRSVVEHLPHPLEHTEIDKFVDTLEIDPYFVRFTNYCTTKQIPLTIISDGFQIYIDKILQKYQIQLPVLSNQLKSIGSKYEPVFPFAVEGCDCFCASCKRNAMLSNHLLDDIVVYIGDGRSDFCPVHYADIVFAKGSLDTYCAQNHISYYPFKSFFDVQILLEHHSKKNLKKSKYSKITQRMAIYLQE
ncbi:MAG: MtnX-like HAD-IB family phosphatase [Candidatus Kapabacteria bacterium]|nr:MtnX-like HAD-IB family phosphatase [Candidatus Kapabacteria bacterium]